MEGTGVQSSNEIAAKRLIKSAAETVRRLDAAVGGVKKHEGFYTAEIFALRMKLHKLCSSFLETCPSNTRRKAEELLWRKAIYEVVASAKSFAKDNPLSSTDKFHLENHLNYGTAVLLDHLSSTLKKAAEAKLLLPKLELLALPPRTNLNIQQAESKSQTESDDELRDSIQRTLLWLGDLARYRIDFGLSTNIALPMHYYTQAVILNPYEGLSYNQIGTLLSSSKDLLAVFYYMRSIMAAKGFPGAEANLRKILERSSTRDDLSKNLVHNFKNLAGKLFIKKQIDPGELGQLCGAVLGTIQAQLNSSKENDFSLIDELLLPITAIIILCEINAKSKTSPQSSACVAFIFSLLSHITSFLVEKLKHLIPELPAGISKLHEEEQDGKENEDEEEDELGRARLRRRKFSDDSSQSDSSDFDLSDSKSDYDSESDSEVIGAHASCEIPVKSPSEFPDELVNILGPLQLLCSYLKLRSETIAAAGESARNIWVHFAQLLNTLTSFSQAIPEEDANTLLEEDWLFVGVRFMENKAKKPDFTCPATKDNLVFLLRTSRIIEFGDFLTTLKETDMEKKSGFYVTPQPKEKDVANQERKEKLMHNMAHLWLKSEVQELERKLDGTSRKKKKSDLSLPYVFVVPDVAVLAHYQHLLKQIVRNKKCIVIVPTVVISELDELKKESSAVRDSIRWLEESFRTGDRFIRAQRPTEHSTIPLLTYPKRKERELWTLFQIAECCNHLNQQHNKAYKVGSNESSSAVLFLTANSLIVEAKDQSISGVFSSIGVDVKEAKTLLINKKRSSGKFRG